MDDLLDGSAECDGSNVGEEGGELIWHVGPGTENLRTRLEVPEVRVGWLSMVEDCPARQRSVEKHEGV